MIEPPTIEQLRYFNQWTMISYRIFAGLGMAYVAWVVYDLRGIIKACAMKYLGGG